MIIPLTLHSLPEILLQAPTLVEVCLIGLFLAFSMIQNTSINARIRPEEDFGELFKAVQGNSIFEDSKTFTDCIPLFPTEVIMSAFAAEKNRPDFDLKTFVLHHFKLPSMPGSDFTSDVSIPVSDHIIKLWPILTRQPEVEENNSRLPLPNAYVVPGGRFREVYYWDSYFIMLGLQASGEHQLVQDMLDNFTYLINTVGHIPNGNRSYYISRSQPPFYALMVKLVADKDGPETFQKYEAAIEKEYLYWMDGGKNLSVENPMHRRVVRMPDGSLLNRYWDDIPLPRPESYLEDVHLAKEARRDPAELYRDVRAGTESGWDFTSRWLADGKTLKTINTTDIIPVDLNCLLYYSEEVLSQIAGLNGNSKKQKIYARKAAKRKKAILKYCWSKKAKFFLDYDYVRRRVTYHCSLAATFPLYFNIAQDYQAEMVAMRLEQEFLKPGGLVTSLVNTGEQWDAPNGWAPLQWISILGLRTYGFRELAEKVKKRWISLNITVYQETGKLVEKYNVEDINQLAGGGEYILQDGFGWTNGVLLKLLMEDAPELESKIMEEVKDLEV